MEVDDHGQPEAVHRMQGGGAHVVNIAYKPGADGEAGGRFLRCQRAAAGRTTRQGRSLGAGPSSSPDPREQLDLRW